MDLLSLLGTGCAGLVASYNTALTILFAPRSDISIASGCVNSFKTTCGAFLTASSEIDIVAVGADPSITTLVAIIAASPFIASGVSIAASSVGVFVATCGASNIGAFVASGARIAIATLFCVCQLPFGEGFCNIKEPIEEDGIKKASDEHSSSELLCLDTLDATTVGTDIGCIGKGF